MEEGGGVKKGLEMRIEIRLLFLCSQREENTLKRFPVIRKAPVASECLMG